MAIQDLLGKELIMFDGAMGTMLHRAGLPVGEIPEAYNLTHPEVIKEIHASYVQAGADVVTTNTFQANEFKLQHGQYSVEEVIQAGVEIAQSVGAKYVALDIGPLGQMMEPIGTVTFEQAYEIFARQVKAGVAAGADLILFETFSDLLEAKAAVLAAKENSQLPVICTMTFEKNQVTLLGNDPVTATIALQALGVDAVGVNCSLGPKETLPIIERMLKYAQVPVIAQPNAGLPKFDGKQTYYDISPEQFAEHIQTMVSKGVAVVGGCCGTTPEHMVATKAVLRNLTPVKVEPWAGSTACSGRSSMLLTGQSVLLGGAINLADQEFSAGIVKGQLSHIPAAAKKQQKAGAQIIQLKAGALGQGENSSLTEIIRKLQRTVSLPTIIEADNLIALAEGVRTYNGKPIISSAHKSGAELQEIMAMVKHYGTGFLGRMGENAAVSTSSPEWFERALKFVQNAEAFGIGRENILIDCWGPMEIRHQDELAEALKTVARVKQELKVKTTLELSQDFFREVQEAGLTSLLAQVNAGGLDLLITEGLSSFGE